MICQTVPSGVRHAAVAAYYGGKVDTFSYFNEWEWGNRADEKAAKAALASRTFTSPPPLPFTTTRYLFLTMARIRYREDINCYNAIFFNCWHASYLMRESLRQLTNKMK
jgi:hypothetical protein